MSSLKSWYFPLFVAKALFIYDCVQIMSQNNT